MQKDSEMKNILLLFLFLSPFLSMAQLENETLYTNLKKALEEPEKVTRLKLSKERLRAIPPEVFLFPNLKELDLSKNKIEEVTDSIGLLVNLVSLNLSNNKLTALPASIGKLKDLKMLYAARNEIHQQ